MWDWQQLLSVTVVLIVGIWLVIGIMRVTPQRNDAAVRDEFNRAVRAATPRPSERPKPKQDLWTRAGEAIKVSIALSLMLIAVVGVVWAAFALHPGFGVAVIAIGLLLMLMASG